jgi:hypothetical protein
MSVTGELVLNGDGRSGPVHKGLLAGFVDLPQNHALSAPPPLVEFAEAAVEIPVRVLFAVFLPKQLQRDVFARLKLSADKRESSEVEASCR